MTGTREGPRITIKASCFDCKHCQSESYHVQSDSGSTVYCNYWSFSERKRVGDTDWTTPDWCPILNLPNLRELLKAASELIE